MAETIQVKLPDGTTKDVPRLTTPAEIARSISPRLADAALAAKADGQLIDLSQPLERDVDRRERHRPAHARCYACDLSGPRAAPGHRL